MLGISFRTLQSSDMSMLYDWLNRPHMRTFYQHQSITIEEVKAKYGPRLEGTLPVKTHIVHHDQTPIGMIQSYLIQDYPNYVADIGVAEGISLDFFIGDEQYIGRGLGSQMLRSYVEQIAFSAFPNESTLYICHETSNAAALATSKSVGFPFLRNVTEENKASSLFFLTKL